MPVPSSTTLLIICAELVGGRLASSTRVDLLGLDRSCGAPVGVDDPVAEARAHQPAAVGDAPRPRPSAAASTGACPGRSPCARRRRAGSSATAAGRPSTRRWRRIWSPGSPAAAWVEAEALHVLRHRALAELLADLGPDRVDRVVSASVRSMSPKLLAVEVLQRDAARSSSAMSPSTSSSGVNLPAVERRRRGHDLERRARRVAGLRGAVEQRRVGAVAVEPAELASGPLVRVVARHARPSPARARCRGSSATTAPLLPARAPGWRRAGPRGRARARRRRPPGACRVSWSMIDRELVRPPRSARRCASARAPSGPSRGTT